MTIRQRFAIAVLLAAALIAALYEAKEATRTRDEVRALRQQQLSMAGEIQQLQRALEDAATHLARLEEERADSANNAELLRLRGELARLRDTSAGPTSAPLTAEANSWIERVGQIKKYLEQYPDKAIPELQFLTPGDWLSAGREPGVDDEKDLRKTLRGLRQTAKARVSPLIYDALTEFTKANGGKFPTEITQLKLYFSPPLEDSIQARYTIVPASDVARSEYQYPGTEWLIAEKAPADVEFDSRVVIGPHGRGLSDFDGDLLIPAVRAFEAANPGVNLGNPAQLLPYTTTPEQQMALQRSIARVRARPK